MSVKGEIIHSYERSLSFFYRRYGLFLLKNVKCVDNIMSFIVELISIVRGRVVLAVRVNNFSRRVFLPLIEGVDSFANPTLESIYFMRG